MTNHVKIVIGYKKYNKKCECEECFIPIPAPVSIENGLDKYITSKVMFVEIEN